MRLEDDDNKWVPWGENLTQVTSLKCNGTSNTRQHLDIDHTCTRTIVMPHYKKGALHTLNVPETQPVTRWSEFLEKSTNETSEECLNEHFILFEETDHTWNKSAWNKLCKK